MAELTFDDVLNSRFHNDFIWAMHITAKYPPFLALLSTWPSRQTYDQHPLNSKTRPYYLAKCDRDTKLVNWNSFVEAKDYLFADNEEEINAMYNKCITSASGNASRTSSGKSQL